MYREPDAWHALMERLSTMVIAYLRAQVEAGADVVQLFDSWVGGLGPSDYATYVQPHVRRIFDALWATCRRSTSGPGPRRCSSSWRTPAATSSGVDHRVSLADAWQRIGEDRGVQGNLDSARLLAGWEATRSGADAVLREAAGRTGHVFNLGHGVLPATDTDLLRRLVDLVHETTARTEALAEVVA